MWFKHLHAYRLSAPLPLSAEACAEKLAAKPFTPCGSQDLRSGGFIAPAAHAPDLLCIDSSGALLVALKTQEKVLPGSVLREWVDEKVADIETAEMRKVGKKEKKELKEAAQQELLPRAFSRSRVCRALIDPEAGWVLVEASTASRAEEMLTALRGALETLPTRLLRTQVEPSTLMTAWLEHGAGEGFTVDADCELRSPEDGGAVVRCVRQDLGADEVQAHLAAGKIVSKLALTYADRVSFVLGDKHELKRIAFLDVLQDEMKEEGSADAMFDAALFLMVREFRELLQALLEALGGEMPSA